MSKQRDPDSSDHKLHPPLAKAPPPIPAVVSMVCLALVAAYLLPSYDEIDKIATTEAFKGRIFPEYMSLNTMVGIRFCFGILCFGVTLQALLSKTPVEVSPVYLSHSKLRKGKIQIKGRLFLYPFTSWCWNLLGTSFFTLAYTGWKAGQGESVSPWLLRGSLIAWEMAAPFTFLVGAVVKYALWPASIREHGHGSSFRTTRALLQHNANVIMALTELILLGGVPVRMSHVSLSVLFGVAYVFFSWSTMLHWNPENGPAALYFFMDTTLGRTSTLALFALVVVLMVSFGLFSCVDRLSDSLGHSVAVHVSFLVVLCLLVCRFRD